MNTVEIMRKQSLVSTLISICQRLETYDKDEIERYLGAHNQEPIRKIYESAKSILADLEEVK